MDELRATHLVKRKLEVLVMHSYTPTRLWKVTLVSTLLLLVASRCFADSPFQKDDIGVVSLPDICGANIQELPEYADKERSLAMLVAGSYICTNGAEEPDDPPIPMRLSKSCSIVPGVAHLFQNEGKLQFFSGDKIQVIASHGVDISQSQQYKDIYKDIFRIDEMVPVFTHKDLGAKKLSSQTVREILEGRVTEWGDIGANGGKIRVHLHGSSMQRQAFSAFLEKSGIEMGVDVQKRFAPDYNELVSGAIADPNSISFGIAGFEANGLTLVEIDGLDPRTHQDYPLSLPIYYGVQGTDAYDVFGRLVQEVYGHK